MPAIPSMALNEMHRAEKRYEVGRVFGKQEAKQRQLRSILNKLTPENFKVLFKQVLDVTLFDATDVPDFVLQIVRRAVGEPIYCEMYAELCYLINGKLPFYLSGNDKMSTVKRLVLNECQKIFERFFGVVDEGTIKLSQDERENDMIKTHIHMLGSIQFMGELFKKTMIPLKIMHHIIQVFLEGYPNPDEKNIEALCLLMTTAGEMLDGPSEGLMNKYFCRMLKLSANQKLSSRVRLILMNVIDLRNEWQRIRKTEKPKKTEDVHTIYRNGSKVIDLFSSDENDVDLDDHFVNTACLDVKIQEERRVEEDCYILEPDACQLLTTDLERKVALADDSEDDVCIISEKGQVACRDYPHSRHLCAQYPFNSTNHENSCAQCYCYVCDERAPCELWEGKLGHCHASDKEHKWIDLRAVFRLKRKI